MRWLVIATLVCIAGCAALIATGSSRLMIAIGIVLGGIAFVLVVSGAFYAVGRSEDRARAAQARGPDPDGPAG